MRKVLKGLVYDRKGYQVRLILGSWGGEGPCSMLKWKSKADSSSKGK
jgi:hypothetical protein